MSRKPMFKGDRGSLEVFGGTPRLLQAGLSGGPTVLQLDAPPGRSVNLQPSVLGSHSNMSGVDTTQWPFERKVTLTVLSQPHSFRKLTEVQNYPSEWHVEAEGSQSKQRAKTVNDNHEDSDKNLMKPRKSSSLSEEFLAERATQSRPELQTAWAGESHSKTTPNMTGILTIESKDICRRLSDSNRRSWEEFRMSDCVPHPTAAPNPFMDVSDVAPELVTEGLLDALSSFKQTFVVTDALRPDHPIVYASAEFFTMTGYSPKEVIGQNCRFLQGPDTDPKEVEKIRHALKAGKPFCGRLLNYRKNKTPFWNVLTITPIRDENDKVIQCIGMQVEVSKYTEGVKAVARRPNGLPESLIRYDARQKEMATESVTQLIEAFQNPSPVSTPRVMIPGDRALSPRPGLRSVFHPTFSGIKVYSHSRSSEPHRGRQQQKLSDVFQYDQSPTVCSMQSSEFLSLVGIEKSQRMYEDVAKIELSPSMKLWGHEQRENEDAFNHMLGVRRGIDLATTLERIDKNFVITDPRLPDNPIIFASDDFLELTEYTREEVLGRNCRFLQGPDTDQSTVQHIRDAINGNRDITVQLLNYTKSGKPFWNLFHLQSMRDQKGELQYFIGVQLDGSQYVNLGSQRLSNNTERASTMLVQETARTINLAVRELPDGNTAPDDLWVNHSNLVNPKPHMGGTPAWNAFIKVRKGEQKIGLKHFKPLKPLGYGDTGSVHLVELRGTGHVFAMKAMDKTAMLDRNKVHRVRTERQILNLVDHPFLPTLYASFQTKTHVCSITDFCPGGELFVVLETQPDKHFQEDSARFYAAEVVLALEYLHCIGVVHRDLKLENILVTATGHIQLTDFDLSLISSPRVEVITPVNLKKKSKKLKDVPPPWVFAQPVTKSNSFVGTEDYIAPEIISGEGHSTAVDWWAFGILLYEMLFGFTPFKEKNRNTTFDNILEKELDFPLNIPVSSEAKLLIQELLNRDPMKRLGSRRGASDIKSHPFFRSINWPLVRNMTPPLLQVPMSLTPGLPESDSEDSEFEWDECEAAPIFNDTI